MKIATLPCRFALVVLGWLCASGAHSQIVLFDQPNLQGNKLTVRTSEPDLGASDFRGKAQSLRVLTGTWEVCVSADHRGDCTQFGRGEYPSLDRRFVGTIASARPVAETGNAASPAQAPLIVVLPPVPPAPSSCAVSATEACSACRVSCTNGRQAICTRGTEYPKLIGKPAECAMESQCGCR